MLLELLGPTPSYFFIKPLLNIYAKTLGTPSTSSPTFLYEIDIKSLWEMLLELLGDCRRLGPTPLHFLIKSSHLFINRYQQSMENVIGTPLANSLDQRP